MGRIVSAFTEDVLGGRDAVGVAELVASREVSIREVTDAAIDRVRAVDPELNAVAHEAYDRARAMAGDIDSGDPRPFAGVPSFVKDNNDVRGMPTRHGSAAISPRPARRSYASAKQFVAQGYVVLGKTTLPEFGLTASTEFAHGPATRNPWNTDRSAGASSGGSAALVASGAVPIAHANDGGGSIRIPAAANGLVGLKPTRGRTLDQPGARQLPINVAAEGVVTRTVRDTAHHLAAMERTYHNRRLPVVGLVRGPARRRLHIGVVQTSPSGIGVAPETLADLMGTADLLSGLGHDTSEAKLPSGEHFVGDFSVYWGFLAVLLSSSARIAHRSHFDRSELDPFTKGLIEDWRSKCRATPGAIRRLRRARLDYDEMFSSYDVIISPTLNHPVPPIGYLDPNLGFEELFARMTRYVGFTPINNICGGPAISLPTTLGSDGMPGSVHLSAAHGDETTLLALAYELEAARPFPSIASLPRPR